VKQARADVAAFEAELQKSATATQRNDAAGRGWALTLIVVRDKLLAMGYSAAEAEALVAKLWRASEQGPEAAAEAIREVEAILGEFDEAIENLGSDIGGLLRDIEQLGILAPEGFQAMVAKARAAGVATQELDAFFQGQAKSIADNVAAYVGSIELTTQSAADAMQTAVVGAFNTMIANGMSFQEALKTIAPSIRAVEKALADAGLAGIGAFGTIRDYVNLAEGEITGPLISAAGNLNQILVGLHNTGLLDQQTFAALGQEATRVFNDLIANGASADQALRLMQPTLQTLWELQHDFGLEVDESTQLLIAQGVEAGIVGDKYRSASDKMVLALDRVVLLLEKLLTDLGFELPGAAAAAAQAWIDMANDMSAATASIQVPAPGWTAGAPSPAPPPPTSTSPYAASTGGYVTPGGIQRFGRGGPVAAAGRSLLGAIGDDRIRALLADGEFVFSQQAVENAGGPHAMAALHQGLRMAPPDLHVPILSGDTGLLGSSVDLQASVNESARPVNIEQHFHGVLVDGSGVRRAWRDYLMPELVDAIGRDEGGIRRVIYRERR
jgi:uncharacterized protein YoaH (UPF0181 family)